MKFPKRLRYRGKGKVLATIYKRADCYRVYWQARVDGKPVSRFKDFTAYAESKLEADKFVAGVVKGSQAATLSPGQAADALAVFQRLQRRRPDRIYRALTLNVCVMMGSGLGH